MSNEKIKMIYQAYLPQITATSRRNLKSKEHEICEGLAKKEPCCQIEQRKGLWEGLHSSSGLGHELKALYYRLTFSGRVRAPNILTQAGIYSGFSG